MSRTREQVCEANRRDHGDKMCNRCHTCCLFYRQSESSLVFENGNLQAKVAELEVAQKLQRFRAGSMPDVGRYFAVYANWDEEPTMCVMTDAGPRHSLFNVRVEDPMYGGGGSLVSELEFKYVVMWAYVPDVPNWDVVKLELPLTDESGEGES